MSHDQGKASAHHTTTPMRHPGPPGDRPSLFAGMTPDDADDRAPQRVRILSTLASTRPSSIRASGSPRAHATRPMGWQVKALLALMVMGIVGLLAGFAIVLSDGHPGAHRLTQAAPGMTAPAPVHRAVPAATTPTPAVAALPKLSTAPPLPAQAAVIENITPTVLTAAAVPHHATASDVPPATGALPQASPAVQVPDATQPAHHALPGPARSASPRTAARSRDADVALLEAMFTHAGPTPASARTDPALFKRCQDLQGRARARCQAQVCRQHPTARLCDPAR